MKYKGLIFDMDGTLTVPAIDFASIREQLGIGSGDLISVIESWPEERQRSAWKLIEKYEEDVREMTVLQPGCRNALVKFKDAGLKLGILTRNSQKGVDAFLKLINFSFDIILTREHPHVKPSPQPVHDILAEWKLSPEKVLVVGDFIHDIESGNAAGTDTCFFSNPGATSYAEFADFSVLSFQKLEKVVFIPDFFSVKYNT